MLGILNVESKIQIYFKVIIAITVNSVTKLKEKSLLSEFFTCMNDYICFCGFHILIITFKSKVYALNIGNINRVSARQF